MMSGCDRGDTLKVTQITDRTRASVRDFWAAAEVKIVQKTDAYVHCSARPRFKVSGFRIALWAKYILTLQRYTLF